MRFKLMSKLSISLMFLSIQIGLYTCHDCGDLFFDCGNGKCLAKFFLCDGDNDCGNFEDELNCHNGNNGSNIDSHQPITSHKCPSHEFACNDSIGNCIPLRWVCDGQNECANGADEQNCTNKLFDECKGDFQCGSHECIPAKWQCDGTYDCHDRSDEANCSVFHSEIDEICDKRNNRYRCQLNHLCIDYSKVCDGHKDCPNGDDEEQNCKADKCNDKKCSHICFVDQHTKQPVCSCPAGYQLIDGYSCQDFDECSEQKQYNLCDQICLNKMGTYRCECHKDYYLQSDNRTCLARKPSPVLYFSTGNDIHGYDIRQKIIFPVITLNDYDPTTIIALDISVQEKQLYYSIFNNDSSFSSIYQIPIDGAIHDLPVDNQRKRLLFHDIKSQIEGIAIDWSSKLMYMTEANRERIIVCQTETLICITLLKNLLSPRGITVVRSRYQLYWTQWHDSEGGIYESRLDGSDMIKLFNDVQWPNDIVFDHQMNRLYWCDGKTGAIEYYDFDIEIRHVVHEDFIRQPYSMVVFENSLYWTDWIDKKLFSCHKIRCHEQTNIFQPTVSKRRGLYGITLYHPLQQPSNDDPCKPTNGRHKCSHICLIRTNETFTCFCPDHMYLSNDNRTCLSRSDDFLIISTGYRLYKFYPDSSATEPFEMIPIPAMFLITDLSYNHDRYEFYLYDRLHDRIMVAKIESDFSYETIVNEDLNSVFSLTFEINSDLLYWVDMIKGTMEAVSIHKHSYRAILNDKLDQPVSMAINALIKTIFVGLKSNNAQILMLTMDGQFIRSVSRSKQGFPFTMVTYPYRNQLIWGDPVLEEIDSIHLNEQRPQKLAQKHVGTIQSMAILNTTLYWTNADSARLYWTSLNSRIRYIESKKMPNSKIDNDVLKVTSGFKHTRIYDYCRSSNNNCQHLCLIGQNGPVCRCSIGFDSNDNGQTCIRNQSTITKPLVHVIDLEDIFDFILSKQKDQIFDSWTESNDTANTNSTVNESSDSIEVIDPSIATNLANSEPQIDDDQEQSFIERNELYLWFVAICMVIAALIVCIKLNLIPFLRLSSFSNLFGRSNSEQPQSQSQTVIETDVSDNNNNNKYMRNGQVRFFSNPNYQLTNQFKSSNNTNNNNNVDNDLLIS